MNGETAKLKTLGCTKTREPGHKGSKLTRWSRD